jgi:flagellar hook-associated protein 3 FlgL
MSGSLINIYNDIAFALSMHAEAMAKLQEQASTGSRINRASDDSSAAYRVLGLNSEQRLLANCMDNISQVSDVLELSSSIIEKMISTISEEKVQMTQIIGGIYTQEGRERLAEGINDALEQMVSFANTKHVDQYLFGGSDTSSAPYVVQRSNGEITSITYQGSNESLEVEMSAGVETSSFYVGDSIFRCSSRSSPVFLGDTGAAAGTGTSSVKGDVWLTVTDGGGGTYNLSIDDGVSTFNTDGTDTNLAVSNSNGEVLYVDTTAITATGVDLVRVPGTYDVFNTLISIRDMLRNERGLSDAQLTESLNSSMESLEEIRGHLVEKQISIGSKIGFLDSLKSTLENIKYDTEDEAVTLQQADITQVAIDISRREVLYQMSLAIAARLISMSLLDFIQ